MIDVSCNDVSKQNKIIDLVKIIEINIFFNSEFASYKIDKYEKLRNGALFINIFPS